MLFYCCCRRDSFTAYYMIVLRFILDLLNLKYFAYNYFFPRFHIAFCIVFIPFCSGCIPFYLLFCFFFVIGLWFAYKSTMHWNQVVTSCTFESNTQRIIFFLFDFFFFAYKFHHIKHACVFLERSADFALIRILLIQLVFFFLPYNYVCSRTLVNLSL